MNGKIMNGKIMNGSGQGLRQFRLMNGIRHWLDEPDIEWQKFQANPSYQKRKSKKTNLQTSLFKDHETKEN